MAHRSEWLGMKTIVLARTTKEPDLPILNTTLRGGVETPSRGEPKARNAFEHRVACGHYFCSSHCGNPHVIVITMDSILFLVIRRSCSVRASISSSSDDESIACCVISP